MRETRPQTIQPAVRAGRFLFGTFGFVFGGIGLSVIIFMASMNAHEFGTPPMFFRVFASLIGLGFVAFGGTMLYSAIRGGAAIEEKLASLPDAPDDAKSTTPNVGYTCPSCGASLGEKADVSPMGDVKCTHCGRWFNVHKSD